VAKGGKPNILILWGDDIGWWNISYNNRGQMGYRTPNIDRIGNEGMTFTDYYGHRAVLPVGPRLLRARTPFAPASPRWECPAPMWVFARKTRQLRHC
jgi:arylsulfatase A-like enzyme